MTAGNGNEPAWRVGDERVIEGEISLCERGYYASPSLWDALTYAPGPIACLVNVDDMGEEYRDGDKLVSPRRKVIAAVDIGRELRLFAADCAEHVLHIYEREHPDDDRPRRAIQAARDYADGRIRDAARAAAWDAEQKWQREQFDARFGDLFREALGGNDAASE